MRFEFGRDHNSQPRTRRGSVLLGLSEALVVSAAIGVIQILESGSPVGAIAIDWLLLTLGLIAFLVPGHWPTDTGMPGKQLKSEHPQYDWVRWLFPLLQVLLLFGFPLLAGELVADTKSFSLTWSENEGAPLLFGGAYAASLALLSGVVAIVTGIYAIFVYRNGYRYYRNGDSRKLGAAQAVIGTVVLIATVVYSALWS